VLDVRERALVCEEVVQLGEGFADELALFVDDFREWETLVDD
jgi:hypothetical protein